jgi:hypothetical protein
VPKLACYGSQKGFTELTPCPSLRINFMYAEDL